MIEKRNIKKTVVLYLIVCISSFFACNKTDTKHLETSKVTEISNEFQNKQCLLVSYLVKDVEEWKTVFDKYEPQRQIQNINVLEIFRSYDNPNDIYMLMEIDDYESAEQFFLSADYSKEIRNAGVITGPDVIHFNTIQQYGENHLEVTDYLIINHLVDDVERWKKIFEGNDFIRKRKGLEVMRIFSSEENPNDITILLSTANLDSAIKYFSSHGIPEIIKQSGLAGPLDIRYFNVLHK